MVTTTTNWSGFGQMKYLFGWSDERNNKGFMFYYNLLFIVFYILVINAIYIYLLVKLRELTFFGV